MSGETPEDPASDRADARHALPDSTPADRHGRPVDRTGGPGYVADDALPGEPAQPAGESRRTGREPASRPSEPDSFYDPPTWLDNQPDWLDDAPPPDSEEPWWLDQEGLLDPEGDDREWIDWEAITAEAEQADRDEGQALARECGFDDAYLHTKGMPSVPGVQSGPAGGFGQGEILDQAPPSLVLAGQADYASGKNRDFTHVTDDQLAGLLYARRRLLAWQAWERLMTIAEYIRRRPAPGAWVDKASGMPTVWDLGVAGEIRLQLAITRHDADHLLALAWDLIVKLPGTSARLRVGILDEDKAGLISMYCANLTPAEARQAEDIMYTAAGDDIETMTWGMLRDRIAKAVIEVNPDAARKRREAAARERRIETRPEVSGNAMIAGRELPPAAVLAMDQALTARARILRKLGVPGRMDELRVQAFLERWDLADPETELTRQAPPATGQHDHSDSLEHCSSDHRSPEHRSPEHRSPDHHCLDRHDVDRRSPEGHGRDGHSQDGDDSHRSGGDHGADDGEGRNDSNDGSDGDSDSDSDSDSDGDGKGGNGGRGPRPGGIGPAGPGSDGCACGGTSGGGRSGAGTGGGLAGQIHLTTPVTTLTEMAGRPGVLRGTGPIDPYLTRDLADAASRRPGTGYHFTITDKDGRPVAHACGKPAPGDPARPSTRDNQGKPYSRRSPSRDGPGSPDPDDRPTRNRPGESRSPGHDQTSGTGAPEPRQWGQEQAPRSWAPEPPQRGQEQAPRSWAPEPPQRDQDRTPRSGATGPSPPGPPPPEPARLEIIDRGPGSYGTWRYKHGDRVIIFEFEDLTGPCDHRHQAAGHEPGKRLRHLTGVLHQTCTNPGCRRPEGQCDYEHARPWEQGGITCWCQAGPVCRRDHRDKQRKGWKIEGTGTPGWFTWTVPSGRKYLSKPTVYPI